jgi:putative Mg2+ transporter-C (MgtC) family protein
MISTVELDVVVKLILAAVLGGLVGLEREWDRRPAGLRTNMLICIGVTLFGMIGTYYFKDTGDVSRIWQNI